MLQHPLNSLQYQGDIMLRFLMLLIILYPLQLSADEMVTDLNGFRLQQLKTAVENSLGKPAETSEKEDINGEMYRIDEDSYMVFTYSKKRPLNIQSIQITGYTKKTIPFQGLVLGDSIEKIERVLGKPTSIEKTELPNVSALKYKGCNYIIEVDDKGRLYTIKLFTTDELMTKTQHADTEWEEFKFAVNSKDFKRICEMLRPDVEIYKDKKILSINQRYIDFIANPDKQFLSALLGAKNSVRTELALSKPEQKFRVIPNFGLGMVYKFYKGKILEEIVFFPYNGKYRIYEIAFRKKREPGT